MAFFGVNFILQKFCQCKKNDKYQVCDNDDDDKEKGEDNVAEKEGLVGGGDGRDNLRVTRSGSHHDLLDDHHDLIMCADGHDLESVLSLCHYQFCFHFDKEQVTCLRIPSCCYAGSREIV